MTEQQPVRPNAFLPALALLAGVGLLMLAVSGLLTPTPADDEPQIALEPTASPTEVEAVLPTATFTPIAASQVVVLDPASVAAGERIFQGTCTACHGFNALGISGLGPSMVGNDFINNLNDDELMDFIIVGRTAFDPDNTTGVAMPPRGGNPTLTDANIEHLTVYIRSLNVGVPVAAQQPQRPTVSGPTAEPREFVLPSLDMLDLPTRAPSDDPRPEGPDPFFTMGEDAYNLACAACHAADGTGVEFVGSSLFDSPMVMERNGVVIFELLIDPQPPVDPRDEFPHPYRGGYSELTDEQILAIIAYLYQLTDQE
jgi:mono/diheme cytochrome c family protein